MEIKNITHNKEVLRFVLKSNEETILSVVKTYLEESPEVDIVGVYKEHHLIDETEFYLKLKKGDAKKFFKAELPKIKEKLQELKIK